MDFKTEHNLLFEVADYEDSLGFSNDWMAFRVGTCEGLWHSTERSYDILAVVNTCPGNGHFNDVLQWFENSCIRDKKNLRIIEVFNSDFKRHLIAKRGFRAHGRDVVKVFKKMKNKSV